MVIESNTLVSNYFKKRESFHIFRIHKSLESRKPRQPYFIVRFLYLVELLEGKIHNYLSTEVACNFHLFMFELLLFLNSYFHLFSQYFHFFKFEVSLFLNSHDTFTFLMGKCSHLYFN